MDDLGRPELEGVEAFDVVLRMPVGGQIGAPNRTTVFINDTSDGPTFCFKKSEYKGKVPVADLVEFLWSTMLYCIYRGDKLMASTGRVHRSRKLRSVGTARHEKRWLVVWRP